MKATLWRIIPVSAVAVAVALAGCGQPGTHGRTADRPSAAHPATVRPSATRPAAARSSATHRVAAPSAATHPATARPATAKMLLGVFERGAEASYQRVDKFAATVGRRPDVVVSFAVWGRPFDASFAGIAHAHGARLLIQLEPVHASVASIAAGRSDKYLRSYATAVRKFGHPVILSFAPEFNGPWYPWGWTRSPPATWKAAWRHVVKLFRKRGASNVTWQWTVNRRFTGSGPLPRYWPGSGYVDWVGIDAYYIHHYDTFATVFAPTLNDVRRITGKPVLISETAVGQVAGRTRAIPDLFAGTIRRHLRGLVWFDMDQDRGIYHQNWRLEGHPAAIAAFRRGLASWKSRA